MAGLLTLLQNAAAPAQAPAAPKPSWKDKLRPASFRGVDFFVDSSQFTGGRRVTFHEFPNRDKPFAEDLGKAGGTFRIEGYVLGDDYFDSKDDILEAVTTEGPGVLVHPYYGTMTVQLGTFSIDENTKEGRYAKLSFQFYEAGTNVFPAQVDDKQSDLTDAATAANAAAQTALTNKFSILGASGNVVAAASAKISGAMDAFKTATKNVQATTQGIADLAFAIRNVKANINDIMKTPGQLSAAFNSALGLLQGAVAEPLQSFNAQSALFNIGPGLVPSTGTPSQMLEASNEGAVNSGIVQMAVAGAAVAASSVPFASVQDATSIRDQLRDAIESILLTTDDDNVYQAFNELNAQVVRSIPDPDSQLPNLENVSVSQTTCSLVLAYDLFENPLTEDDIITRNKIKNPAFIMGGTTLEVVNVG